jgi:hypothetical protein
MINHNPTATDDVIDELNMKPVVAALIIVVCIVIIYSSYLLLSITSSELTRESCKPNHTPRKKQRSTPTIVNQIPRFPQSLIDISNAVSTD